MPSMEVEHRNLTIKRFVQPPYLLCLLLQRLTHRFRCGLVTVKSFIVFYSFVVFYADCLRSWSDCVFPA